MKARKDMTKEEQQDLSFRIVWGDYFKGYSYTLIAIILAVCYSSIVKGKIVYPESLPAVLSVCFYSGGTLGFLQDFRVITWGGKGKAETLSKWLLICSYFLGTFFAIIAASK